MVIKVTAIIQSNLIARINFMIQSAIGNLSRSNQTCHLKPRMIYLTALEPSDVHSLDVYLCKIYFAVLPLDS